MKNIIYLISFILMCASALAQQNITARTIDARERFGLPKQDTLAAAFKIPGELRYRIQDSAVYVRNLRLSGKRWDKLMSGTSSSGGGFTTADNGLTANTATNVRLGGTGIQNTNIAWSNFTFTNTWNTLSGTGLTLSSTSTSAAGNNQKLLNISLSGANATTTQTTYGAYVTNSHTGTIPLNYGGYFSATNGVVNVGVQGHAGDGTGVYGTGASASSIGVQGDAINIGVYGTSTIGYGLRGATSAEGVAVQGSTSGSSTNTILTIAELERSTDGTAANGIGGSVDFKVRTTLTERLANQLISKWTNATDASRTSQFIIKGINNAVTGDLLILSGNGAINAPWFAGTDTRVVTSNSTGDLAATAYLDSVIQVTGTSSNATPFNIDTIYIPVNYMVTVEVEIQFENTALQEVGSVKKAVTIKNVSGTNTIVGAIQTIRTQVAESSVSAAASTISLSGGLPVINLTGIAATNMDWQVTYTRTYKAMTPP